MVPYFDNFRTWRRKLTIGLLGLLLLALVAGCGGGRTIIKVDGSSTVFPITEAMADEFQRASSDIQVTVGVSGTGGGFERFCGGEIDITDASRPIKPIEAQACADSGIEYIELPVAFDGLSVMINPDNDWVDFLTVDELKDIWMPGSSVEKWSDVRSEWPDDDIKLVGADTDSGTFDYFTKAIMGEEGASRPDYTASTDDNVLVRYIAGEKDALGYFGYAYYGENTDKLKLVPIDPGSGPVSPSVQSIIDNSYIPLSRPLFIYVSLESSMKIEVRDFVSFYLARENTDLVREVGYVELSDRVYQLVKERFDQGVTGSLFGEEGSQIGVTVEEVLEGK